MWLLIVLSQNGFFVWLPLLGCVGLVSFFFKVSLSNESSVCACFVAGPGLALSSRFFKPVVDFRRGHCGTCIPNVGECSCRKARHRKLTTSLTKREDKAPAQPQNMHTLTFLPSSYFKGNDKTREGAYFVQRTHFGTRLNQDSKRRLLY